ncbi:MAG: hypothetical protein IT519_02920 [Burkholderiales bacterium]|nr:hypothetical protein [Burkholderiales bacterium]
MITFSRPFSAACLVGSALASLACAQGLPPGLSRNKVDTFLDFTTNPVLTPLTTNARPIYACSVHRLPSDRGSQVTLSFTVRALQGYGNPAYSGFVLAKWDPTAATPLTLIHDADAVNGAFVDYNLNLEPSGRYAVFDRFGTPGQGLPYLGIHLAARVDDLSPYGAPVPVANVQGSNGFGDPAIGTVNGQLKLFYAGQATNSANVRVSGILMDDLVGAGTPTPQAAGHPVLVSEPSDPSRYCHSPSLVHGADGDVEGLFVAEGNAAGDRSDVYFAADLDPTTPQVLAVTNTSWLSSGGNSGGVAIFTQRDNAQAPRVIEGAWLVGDEVAPGGIADVTMSAYGAPGKPPAWAMVFCSPFWLQSPVSLPGVIGELGVLPIPFLSLRPTGLDQRADWQLRIPHAAFLRGLDLRMQGLATHVAADDSVVRTLTNTATIRVR